MKMLRTTLLVAMCLAVPAAFAQWQWIDKDGRKVFSDQAPPPTIPANKILKRPGNRPAEPEPVAAAAAPQASSAASSPKVSGKDKELEDKKKQAAAAAEAAKKKAYEDELSKAQAENCTQAKRAKSTLDSGIRIVTTNDKGEREYLDDNARSAEAKRLEGIIARDCKSGS